MIEAGLVLCPQEAFIDCPTQTDSCREFIKRGLCWREGGVVGNAPRIVAAPARQHPAVRSIHGVSQNTAARSALIETAGKHPSRHRGLGGEADRLGNMGLCPARLIPGPGFQQIQMPVDTRMTSPQSNGMLDAFVETLSRDRVRVNPLPDAKTVLRLIGDWIEDYNESHPHSGLK